MIDVRWADPPAAQGGKLTRREQREFAEALRNRRDHWAVYPTSGSSVAIRALTSRISNGRQGAFGEGFEAVSRGGVVYVRFVGGSE